MVNPSCIIKNYFLINYFSQISLNCTKCFVMNQICLSLQKTNKKHQQRTLSFQIYCSICLNEIPLKMLKNTFYCTPLIWHEIKTNCIKLQKLNQRYAQIKRKRFSCYILLTDQISLFDCLYFLRYWPICVLGLLVSQFVTSQILKSTLSF